MKESAILIALCTVLSFIAYLANPQTRTHMVLIAAASLVIGWLVGYLVRRHL